MKKLFKYFSVFITFFVMITMFRFPVQAASASVSVSSGQVYVGDTVTFTVSATGAGYVNISGAVNTSIWLENSSQSFTVTAGSEGALSVSISGVLADFTTEQDVPVSGSASVQVVSRPQIQPTTPETPTQPEQNESTTTNTETTSSQQEQTETQEKEEKNQEEKEKQENSEYNLRLASLSVSEGTLNPDFDSDQYTYDVTVDSSVKSIKIDATAQDENVEVNGMGKKDLNEDTSTFEIVTSFEGQTSTYTLTVHKRQRGLIVKNKKGEEFEIVNEASTLDGFEEHRFMIEDQEVFGLSSSSKNILLVSCLNEKQEKNYYIYNEDKNLIESIYIPVTLFLKNYAVVDIKEDEELNTGFKEADIEIDSQVLPGYEFESKDFKNYALLYLMDENGDKNFYQFERSENTLQKYSLAAPITIKRYESLLKKKSMDHKFMMGMLVVDILLVIGLIVLLVLYKRSVS